MSTQCEWFAMCTNEAFHELLHPIIGWVPICPSCAVKLDLPGDTPCRDIFQHRQMTRIQLCVDCQRPFQGPGAGCPDCQALALSILRRGQGVSC